MRLIDADKAYEVLTDYYHHNTDIQHIALADALSKVPSAQPERLTDDDFETIRIHLNAYKEKLCNQHRWKEAEEYQRIIDRFIAFASAQPVRHGHWKIVDGWDCDEYYRCTECGAEFVRNDYLYCPHCGALMDEVS